MSGAVYLIGVGPGSADLITLRGLHAVRKADVIIGDALLSPDVLDAWGISRDSRTVLWRDRERSRHEQDDINRLMLQAASEGKTVARLKCGDPLIFGRGQEEAEHLRERGIRCEIIPGLSSATAGPTSAELPLTQRGSGRSFAVATGRVKDGETNAALPHADSLVLMMAAGTLRTHKETLREAGWRGRTPVTVIERAEQPWQRRITGTLDSIADVAEATDLQPPAIIIIGEAAATGKQASRPTILFTGLDPTNFRTLGDVLHWPALRVVRDEAGWAKGRSVISNWSRDEYDHVVFTSRIGVTSFFELVATCGRDARILAGTAVIAAGAGTAMRLAEHGIAADGVPDDPGSQGILQQISPNARHLLLVQGSHAPRGLIEALRSRGCDVTRLALHTVQPHPDLGRPLPPHDVIYFVSPSGVRAYAECYGRAAFEKPVWCMGDITLGELHKYGKTGEVVNPYVSAD